MSSTDSLLTTKLYLPPRPPALVARPRLLALLGEGLARPLTLVSAPAGFGKTTLLSEWCASEAGRRLPLAWLSLDGDDNDPSRFLTYLIAALRTLEAGLGESALAAIQLQQPPPPEAILTALLADLNVFSKPFALALDDYQVITSQAAHGLVRFLLDHLPPHMHLVLLTRADPPLPLARLRARSQLTEVRMLGLRFLPDETTAFLNEVMGLDLSAADISALEARTEGWIAGLQLAAFSLRQQADRHAFVAAFAGDDRYVMDYLLEEVLQRQPPQVQAFLLKTSILDRLCGPLCEAVTGEAGSPAILAHLEQSNLFVVPLDNRRHWYRYHHLFSDLLRRRLQQVVPPAEMAGLYQRACTWYEGEGLVVEAVSQALASRDFEHAAGLLDRHVLAVFFHGETMLVHNWLKALPEAVLRVHPLLCAVFANTIAHTGGAQPAALELAGSWLQAAQAALPPGSEGQALTHNFLALSRAYLALWRGDPPPVVIELAQQALAGLPSAEEAPLDKNSLRLRSGLTNNLGISYWAMGDEDAAGRVFSEAQRIGESCGDLLNAYTAVSNRSRIQRRHGRLAEAAALFRETLATIRTTSQSISYAGILYVGLGKVLLEWNDLPAAEAALVKGLELSRLIASPDVQLESHLALAGLRHAQGQSGAARGLLDEVEGGSMKGAASAVAAYRVRLDLVRAGEDPRLMENALRWAKGRALSDPDSSWFGAEALTLVRVRIAQCLFGSRSRDGSCDLGPVLQFLEGRIRETESTGGTERTIELLILQALARQARDDIPGALDSLRGALALAEPGGYVRTFVNEGLPLQRLLARLRLDDPGLKEYQGRLLAAWGGREAAPGSGPQPLVEPLSARELEVLCLLADGISNQEIARRLVITLNTAKKHITHIFEKLGVTDRVEAGRRARDLGLVIPPKG